MLAVQPLGRLNRTQQLLRSGKSLPPTLSSGFHHHLPSDIFFLQKLLRANLDGCLAHASWPGIGAGSDPTETLFLSVSSQPSSVTRWAPSICCAVSNHFHFWNLEISKCSKQNWKLSISKSVEILTCDWIWCLNVRHLKQLPLSLFWIFKLIQILDLQIQIFTTPNSNYLSRKNGHDTF